MKQETMGWQYHQLDHMQITCTTLLQTANHTSTSSFYRPDALPDAQPAVSKFKFKFNDVDLRAPKS